MPVIHTNGTWHLGNICLSFLAQCSNGIERSWSESSVDDGREHIIGDKLLGCSAKEPECIQKALVNIRLALAVGELQIQHLAVAFDDSHTIELSTDRSVA